MEKRQSTFFLKKDNLDSAKYYYRKALKFKSNNNLKAQILVNFGNCFDYIGRVVESLECYDQALNLRPNFGMALGNKGKALYYYADLCGQHQGTFIIEAYTFLKAAKLAVTPEAAVSFSMTMKAIEQRGKNLPLNNPPNFPGYVIKGKSKFERYLIDFCLRNQLYLNVCNFCKKCNATIGDTITIKTMTVPAKDYSYLTLSSYLNEIKQDYVTARAIIVLSSYERLNLDFFDRYVSIADTLDQSVSNIYIQLTKTSFKTSYDILDKIAFFINDYLHLGIKEDQINFSTIWYTSKDRTNIKEAIIKTNNPSLNALFNIHKDLDYGAYRTLKDTRNSLTHRFVKIKVNPVVDSDRVMSEETLTKQTLDLTKLVRNCIIYLLQFVQIEELKKPKKSSVPAIPITVPLIPYRQKNRRTKKRNKG
jgi:tetratricopeptide (TPR) repeat protein